MNCAVFYEFSRANGDTQETGRGHCIVIGIPQSNASLDALELEVAKKMSLDGNPTAVVTITGMTVLPEARPQKKIITR